MIRYAEPDDEFPGGLEPVAAGGPGVTVLVLESDGRIGGVAAVGPAAGEPGGETGELSVLSLLPDPATFDAGVDRLLPVAAGGA